MNLLLNIVDDETRVKLLDGGSDYINASYIEVRVTVRKFTV